MLNLRLIIFGASHSDKTTFVKTVRDMPNDIEMAYATYVEGTYGNIYGSNDSYVISLLVAPPQNNPQRFFTWEVLAQSMNGCLLLVNGDHPHDLEEAKFTLNALKTHLAKHPVVIVSTGKEFTCEQIQKQLETSFPVLTCQVAEREASLQILWQLLDGILKASHA